MPDRTASTSEFGRYARTILGGNCFQNETLGYTEASY